MYKKLKRILSMMLLATFALSYSAFAVDTDIQPYASIYLTHKEASLASSNNQLAVNFSVVSNISVAKIGVSSITLHDVTSGTTKNFSGLTVSGKDVRQYEMTPALVRRGFACHTLDANQM